MPPWFVESFQSLSTSPANPQCHFGSAITSLAELGKRWLLHPSGGGHNTSTSSDGERLRAAPLDIPDDTVATRQPQHLPRLQRALHGFVVRELDSHDRRAISRFALFALIDGH